jgi:hypothetical protein
VGAEFRVCQSHMLQSPVLLLLGTGTRVAGVEPECTCRFSQVNCLAYAYTIYPGSSSSNSSSTAKLSYEYSSNQFINQ